MAGTTGISEEPSIETSKVSTSQSLTRLAIDGMTCGNCARHVTEALQGVDGVRSAVVSLDANQATVRWNTGVHPDTQAVIVAVQKAGFEAKVAAIDTVDKAEHRLSGWKLNLWVGLPITGLLM